MVTPSLWDTQDTGGHAITMGHTGHWWSRHHCGTHMTLVVAPSLWNTQNTGGRSITMGHTGHWWSRNYGAHRTLVITKLWDTGNHAILGHTGHWWLRHYGTQRTLVVALLWDAEDTGGRAIMGRRGHWWSRHRYGTHWTHSLIFKLIIFVTACGKKYPSHPPRKKRPLRH